jgi:hypothetical protein
MNRFEPQVATLDDDALNALDEALVIETSRLTHGPSLLRGVDARPSEIAVSEIRDEILETYKRGVKIAPQTETRPLIPLYKAAKIALPPDIQVDHQTYHYDFYLVQVIFGTTLASDEYPLRSELTLKLQDDVADGTRRTRPVSLFPARRDIELFKADLDIAVSLDASFNFSAPVAVGNAKADTAVNAKLNIGPLHFAVHKAVVEVTGESSQDILWRYAYEQHVTGANDFKSFLVLKVPQEATHVEMVAAIGLVPCKPRWFFFKRMLPQIRHQLVLPVTLARSEAVKDARPRRSKDAGAKKRRHARSKKSSPAGASKPKQRRDKGAKRGRTRR